MSPVNLAVTLTRRTHTGAMRSRTSSYFAARRNLPAHYCVCAMHWQDCSHPLYYSYFAIFFFSHIPDCTLKAITLRTCCQISLSLHFHRLYLLHNISSPNNFFPEIPQYSLHQHLVKLYSNYLNFFSKTTADTLCAV